MKALRVVGVWATTLVRKLATGPPAFSLHFHLCCMVPVVTEPYGLLPRVGFWWSGVNLVG